MEWNGTEPMETSYLIKGRISVSSPTGAVSHVDNLQGTLFAICGSVEAVQLFASISISKDVS